MAEIVNCTWKFQFQCPRRWEGLRETADPKVRVCESCLRNVYWCENDAEVRRRAEQGACVAVRVAADETRVILGEVVPGD
jgi:hypothetical protein